MRLPQALVNVLVRLYPLASSSVLASARLITGMGEQTAESLRVSHKSQRLTQTPFIAQCHCHCHTVSYYDMAISRARAHIQSMHATQITAATSKIYEHVRNNGEIPSRFATPSRLSRRITASSRSHRRPPSPSPPSATLHSCVGCPGME